MANPAAFPRSLSARMADAALLLPWSALSSERHARMRRSASDFAACAQAGGRRAELAPARILTGAREGPALEAAARLDPPAAALLLGTAVALLQLHDAYPEGGNHPGSAVLSAVLALLPHSSLGKEEALGAAAAGYEAANRLARAGQPHQQRAGFTPTSVGGAIGAALAAGLMLRLDAKRLAEAVGLAALGAPVAPFQSLRQHGEAAPLHGGLAARAGVEAALLAHAGSSAGDRVLEGDADTPGWLAMMGLDPARIAPESWDGSTLDGVVWKLFPACFSCHLPIETALRAPRTAPGEIASVHIQLPTPGMTLVAEGPSPGAELYDRLMSVRWSVAHALARGEYDLASIDAAPSDETLGLMARTTVSFSPELDRLELGQMGGRIDLRLLDGSVLAQRHQRALFSPPEDGGPAGWTSDPGDPALDAKAAALTSPGPDEVWAPPLFSAPDALKPGSA